MFGTQIPDRTMTADEFIEWSMAQSEGRYELWRGKVVRMASERAVHARLKASAHRALFDARPDGCEAFPDGMSVRIADDVVREPDAALRCGPPLPGDATQYDDPVVVVEVLSPSTSETDLGLKTLEYARVESLRHYLIIEPKSPAVIHHRRVGDRFETSLHAGGTITLDPPGMTLDLDAVLAPVREA